MEGVDDHGCEYMTGGTVVVLGQTGRNFAAGMSGGIAYVLDEQDDLCRPLQPGASHLEKVLPAAEQSMVEPRHHDTADEILLKGLLEKHADYTGSPRAKAILADWDSYRGKFVKVYRMNIAVP